MSIGGRGVQSVEIAGRILATLTEAAGPMMLRDLAAGAGMAPGQAHAYLVSLRKLDLVEQDAATGRYRLGPFALRLGLARLRVSDPLRMASEAIAELSDRLDLMISITVWGDHGPTVVRVHESASQVHANVRAGTVFSLTSTATGMVFAAFGAPDLVGPRLKAELRNPRNTQRPPTRLSLEDVQQETGRVREQGYAVTDGWPVPGVSAISAPVFDHGGQIQLAVTAIGPSGAMDTGAGSAQVEAVTGFARDLSERLGYTPAETKEQPQAERRAGRGV
jgi:DNA-binding IclR family transcriptional regulator